MFFPEETRHKAFQFAAVAASCAFAPTLALSQEEAVPSASRQIIPEVFVIGSVNRSEQTDITPGASAAPVPDAMEVLTRLPGANVNRNGPLSGKAQYRGLSGSRLAVTVDGAHVTPGGPNWMDAPLHYMPAGLTERVTLTRGIAPVSAGPGVGGLIEAESRKSQFSSDTDFQFNGNGLMSLMSNDGAALSAFLALANSKNRFHLFASTEDGDDIESADGSIGATAHERTTYGLGYGFRWRNSEIAVDLSNTETNLTGTPSLPLDIDFFDTDRINVQIQSELSDVTLSVRLFHADIAHGMNNFILREAPDFSQLPLPPFAADDKRLVGVRADATGLVATAALDVRGGQFIAGVDGNFEAHTAVVTDPDFGPFFVNNFNDSDQDRVGLFAEWFGDIGLNWSMELGARYTQVESSTGLVDAFPARLADMDPATFPPGTPPFAVKLLRDRFNAQDRSVSDDNVDVVLEFERQIGDQLRVGIGYGHKQRSPMYVEQFLWIPLEVNAGLGDLNNYVGNINLKPETSDQIELSLDWNFEKAHVSPRFFFRRVDDYIQGVASSDPVVIAVSGNANGDSTPLQFANVDGELFGLDVAARYEFSDRWQIDATLNYVRGERTDIDDDLYRIAPLNGRFALTFQQDSWSLTAESVLVAEQSRISRVIVLDEPRSSNAVTPGYGLVNLYGQWQLRERLQLRFGVENLLDKHYTNHLAGFNRVTNSSVPFGERVPGPGINAFGQVQLSW